jgi:hypothetical protein
MIFNNKITQSNWQWSCKPLSMSFFITIKIGEIKRLFNNVHRFFQSMWISGKVFFYVIKHSFHVLKKSKRVCELELTHDCWKLRAIFKYFFVIMRYDCSKVMIENYIMIRLNFPIHQFSQRFLVSSFCAVFRSGKFNQKYKTMQLLNGWWNYIFL